MLYAESNNTEELQELIALLDDSTYIVPDDVRDSLAKNGRAALLAKMYQRRGDTAALLDLYIQLAEGTIIDRSVSDPVREVTALLRSSREPELVRKHVVWLLRRDPDSGIKVTLSTNAALGTDRMIYTASHRHSITKTSFIIRGHQPSFRSYQRQCRCWTSFSRILGTPEANQGPSTTYSVGYELHDSSHQRIERPSMAREGKGYSKVLSRLRSASFNSLPIILGV